MSARLFIYDNGTSGGMSGDHSPTPHQSRRNDRTLGPDQRGIEGLPIRLVIAVFVGVAALGLMTGMLESFDGFGSKEVEIEAGEAVITLSNDTGGPRTFAVVTEEGQAVVDAQVVVTAGSAPLADGPVVLDTGPDSNEVTFAAGQSPNPDPASDGYAQIAFREGQTRGTLELDIVPPGGGGDYVDDRRNTELVVLAG